MKTIKSILAEIANNEFKENLFAWVIAEYYDTLDKTNKDKFYESLVVYYKKHLHDSELTQINSTSHEINLESVPKDLRIKSVVLNNVRGIPSKIKEIPFGINFFDNNRSQNALILGPNASGKSSLFSAMEYIYSKRIGEADLRTTEHFDDGDKYFIDYLKHFSSIPECSIYTLSGHFDLNKIPFSDKNLRHIINPNNFFISDFDLYENGRRNYLGDPNNEDSFHYLIASSLGLQNFLDFQNIIINLSNYRRLKESNQLSKLNREKKVLEDNIKNWKTEIKKREEEISAIQNQSNPQQLTEIQKRNEDNLVLCQQLLQENFLITFDIDSLKRNIEVYNSDSSELSIVPDVKINELEAQFFTMGLELLNKSIYVNCPFCGESKKEINTIQQDVKTKLEFYETYSKNLQKLKLSFNNIIKDLQHYSIILSSTIYKFESETKLLSNNSEFLFINQNLSELYSLLDSSVTLFLLEEFDFEIQFSLKNSQTLSDTLLKEISVVELEENIQKINQYANFRKLEIENIIKELKTKQTISSSKEQLAIIRNDIIKYNEQIKQAEIKVKSIDADVPALENSVKLVNEIKEKAANYQNIINIKISEVINTVFDPIQKTICEILEDYIDDKNIEIKVYKDVQNTPDGEILSETLKVTIIKKDSPSEEYINPNKYFNTFHYRLFCLMVSCSIAIATRRLTKINIPIIIDDLFYASDYINRNTIIKFLKKLITLFNKYTIDNMETQFIIFTHDEMIFDCASEAIEDFENEIVCVGEHPRENTKYFRFFDFKGGQESSKNIEGVKFWDMAFEIPSKIESFYDLIK